MRTLADCKCGDIVRVNSTTYRLISPKTDTSALLLPVQLHSSWNAYFPSGETAYSYDWSKDCEMVEYAEPQNDGK